ncbi:pyridine nucleotide-disulfide oxidoreductase [Niastella koreensis]|uniref:FAD-dependent pyridine nucleotide-disulfide oxidoreductase n=2 Tax=Niastella koreensis TaxID=354356 RepID=G8T8B5_NIAKG|nr:NAD(P)/FAD-dependent oxidoreductase [Niastella koreensis]AEV99085.1 FAD-dependent pyridine nucleotide-disulfide oxidoreductase [Niastella koreensis GR20-10]OQP44000.1 pyridine nucleotide-disulfide oxidoreductase [Niastella koreensis]
MAGNSQYDVIIVGGSYAGLSAAMSLGRSLRKVLIIDSGLPCNRQTPHSHNFITHDGETPKAIADKAREQVLKYETVGIQQGLAVSAIKVENGFELTTADGAVLTTRKLLFATGVKDLMPAIPGFAECWGITVIHCPYCHGYEVKQQKTGIMSNGDIGFDFSKLIANLTTDLTLFTNGKSTLSLEQQSALQKHNISVVETEIAGFEHSNGQLKQVLFKDGSTMPLKAMYAKTPFVQHCDIPVQLGCALTEQGYLAVDMLGRTSVPGVYAAGDNTAMMRAVSLAVAGGGMAGAGINKELVEESF